MIRHATFSTLSRKLQTITLLIGSMLLSFPAHSLTTNTQGTAQITSVGPISPRAWQTIVITGAHFGTSPPINGCPDHMRVTDVTTNWSVPAVGPFGGCQAGIFVSSWNDNEIVIEGFPSFQRGQDAFKIGDVIKIEVSSAQQGGPTSWYSVRVSPKETRAPASTALAPVPTQSPQPTAPGTAQITSVGPISPRAWQTIVISGAHFGTNPPTNGCPDHMRVTDVTTNWSVPAVGPFGGCQAGIFVSSWNDNQIVIEGFPSFQRGQDAFKIGDVIKIEVSNAQQGGPAAWHSLRVTAEGIRLSPLSPYVPVSTQNSPPSAAVTIPAGTSILIRMIDSVDSSRNKIGDTFHASLDTTLVIGDTVVAPKGADVYGKLAQAKSAGKISGGAELTLEMTGIQISGNIVPVDSTDYAAVAKGRGKQSAARIGGGGALGSIMGGIARGGKGAAIGAGAGAAAGTAVQLATHGQQIHIPSETLLEFKLQQPVTVPAFGASAGTNVEAPPPLEVGSSSAPIASSSTGDMVSPSAVQTGAHDDSGGAAATFEDDFTSDHFLNQSIWSTHGEVLNARILKADTRFVPVRLAFSSLGMSMAGVDGAHQSTGIQSVRSFSTPLTLEAEVMGTIANGNPFALYLVSADGGQYLTLNGHLDRGGRGPYSLELGYTGLGNDAGNAVRRELSRAVSLHARNVIQITVDARGVGTVVVGDPQGSRLAAENNLTVGAGPFFVVLAQWEGWPRTAGPNEAVWGKVTISTASPEAISIQPGPAPVSNPASSNPSQLSLPATVPNDEASVRGAIRSVDFLNLDYPSDCWEHFDGFGKVIHVSNGQWTKEDVGGFSVGKQASEWMVSYGDLKGDGQDEAVVVTTCQGQTNFDYEEVFVFAASSAGPKLLTRLSPSDWGRGEEDNGGNFPVTGVHVSKQQLAVSFLAGGSHACPAWTVTARFEWNSNRFVRMGLDRKPFKCQ